MSNHGRLSVAIVGGGIAGLYCASKLAKRGHSITVFETLNRMGGRIETVVRDHFKLECGPMRFELATQPYFEALANELAIKFAPFPQPADDPQSAEEYSLEKAELPAKGNPKALDLLRLGLYRIFHPDQPRISLREVIERHKDAEKSAIESYADGLREEDLFEIRTSLRFDGQPLHSIGFWNALSRVLSPGALAQIRNVGTFYHLMPENPSASEWSIFWLRLLRSDAKLSTVVEDNGVQTVVDRLVGRLKEKHHDRVDLLTGATVLAVTRADAVDQVRLTVHFADPGQQAVLDFDHVIFALPKVPLLQLSAQFPPEIRRHIDGTIAFPLLKVFAIVKNRWWRGGDKPKAQHGAHLVPTREVHYFDCDRKEDRSHGMVLFYTDRPANSYWSPYVRLPHAAAQQDEPESLRHELARQLLRLAREGNGDYEDHLLRAEKNIEGFVIRDWSKPPFGAASHAWAPGVDVPAVLKQLRAFSLPGRAGANNVHICGEAYSDYQGFIEGALRSSEAVIDSIRD